MRRWRRSARPRGTLAARDDVRAVVLTGAGEKVFMAGADLRALAPLLGTPAMAEHVGLTRPVFDAWRSLPQPVVAALAGNALGGGLELALTCDFLVARAARAARDARGGAGADPGRRRAPSGCRGAWGGRRRWRCCCWAGCCKRGACARHRAGERGRRGARALEEAPALAARLAALPALAVRAAKEAARRGLEAGLDEGLDFERSLFLTVASSADAREGAEAFLGKREPQFMHR